MDLVPQNHLSKGPPRLLAPLNNSRLAPQRTRLFEHVNSISSSTAETGFASRGYILHLTMYGISLMGELNELRRQYKNNKFKVFYFSKSLANIQLFIEFLFEILHEKDEPLIAFIELIKAGLKLREYHQLLTKEKGIHSYLELESYRELTLLNEIKQNHIQLMRSKRRVEKLHNFQLNQQYEQIRMVQNQSLMQEYDDRYNQVVVDGLGLPVDAQTQPNNQNGRNGLSGIQENSKDQKVAPSTSQLELQHKLTLINEEGDDDHSSTDNQNNRRNERRQGIRNDNNGGGLDQQNEGASVNYDSSPVTATDIDGGVNRTREYGQANYMSSSAQREMERSSTTVSQSMKNQQKSTDQYQLVRAIDALNKLVRKFFGVILNSDVLHIVRPLVYVCLVMKHGKKSWVPIQISLAIDLLIIMLVVLRLLGSEKLRHIERRDMTWRNIMSLAKYLIRDPIFENYTLPAIQRVFQFLRIPNALFGIVLSILNYYRYYTYIA